MHNPQTAAATTEKSRRLSATFGWVEIINTTATVVEAGDDDGDEKAKSRAVALRQASQGQRQYQNRPAR
jgi:hypothetical protein